MTRFAVIFVGVDEGGGDLDGAHLAGDELLGPVGQTAGVGERGWRRVR